MDDAENSMTIHCHLLRLPINLFDFQNAVLPSAYPNHMPRTSAQFDTSKTPDDREVEGNTFHAYSIPAIIANLTSNK